MLIAIAVSIAKVRRTLVVNADAATPMVMAETLRQHGAAGLRALSYTHDNWMLPSLLITRPGCPIWLSVGKAG